MKREHGFTLIELMVTVVVASVLVGLAVPGMRTMVQNGHRTDVVNQFVGSLQLTRSEAVTRNRDVLMCAANSSQTACNTSGNWEDGWIVFVDTDSDKTVSTGETVLRKVKSSDVDGFTIRSSEMPTYLYYRSSGRAKGSSTSVNAADFTICDNRGATEARVVSISISGRIDSGDTLTGGSAPTCP